MDENQAILPMLGSVELEYVLRSQSSIKRVKTSCPTFDTILNHGVESGKITCISGDRGTGKTTVRYPWHFLVLPFDTARLPCN
jgi:RecA/RadA recombinase